MGNFIQTVYPWILFLVLSSFFTRLIRGLQFHFLYSSNLSQYKPKSGGQKPWALVTGASDGIGKGFAQQLGALGFNVIIHGRNEKKLQGVKTELEQEFNGIQVRLLVIDASLVSWTEEHDAKVLNVVKDINLTILINNVGGAAGIRPDWATIVQRSPWELDTFINVNLRFMAQITRVLTPILTKDKTQKVAILNVSSGAERINGPYLVTYSGSKAFVSRWSGSLDVEFKAEGLNVDVMSAIVGKVATAATGRFESDVNLFCPSAIGMAKVALSKLGSGRVVCTPHLGHALQLWLLTEIMPTWVMDKMMIHEAGKEIANMAKLEKAK